MALQDSKQDSRRSAWVVFCLFVVALVVFSTFSLVRHARINSSGLDLGIFDQVVWNTAHGRWFASTLVHSSHLADHFSPILLLVSSLYLVWSDVRVLLLLQALALALGVFPMAWIAQKHIPRRGAGLLFAGLYLLYPSVGFINRFDFHEVALAVPLLLFALYCIEEDRLRAASVLLVLALLVREDVGLSVMVVGLYCAVVRHKRGFGWAWAGIGLGWSLSAVLFVMPYFSQGPATHWARYGWLGQSATEVIKTLLTSPAFVLQTLLKRRARALFPVKMLLPLAFVPLVAPEILFMALPSFVPNWLASNLSQSSIYFHYMALTIPFLLCAAIRGAQRLLGWATPRLGRRFAAWPLLAALLLTCSLAAFAWDNPFIKPLRRPFWPVYDWERKPNTVEFAAASVLIPADASLETSMAYVPHFSQRRYVYISEFIMPDLLPPEGTVQYILLDLRDLRWRTGPGLRALQALDQGYGILYFQNGVILLERGRPEDATDRQRVQSYVDAVANGQISSYD